MIDNNAITSVQVLAPLKRGLVTGARGFIGQALCAELKKQDVFVRGLSRKSSLTEKNNSLVDESFYVDLKDLSNLESQPELMHNIDTVFHLAGVAHATRSRSITSSTYWQVNVKATEKLLHMAHQSGVKRFIYFSSVKAIGNPTDDYGSSKLAAEERVLALGKQYGMHVVIVRPALVYGAGMKGNLAMMMRGIRQGWFPVLPETHNQRSLISLDDLIDFVCFVAITPQTNGNRYTVTDGQCYSSRQLYNAMRKALGKPVAKWEVPFFIFKMLATAGDLLQDLLKRDLPFNSDILEKLLGSAYYPSEDLQTLGWVPKHQFLDVISRSL